MSTTHIDDAAVAAHGHKAAGEESLAPQQVRIMGRTSYYERNR
jgi:hypothetical protein